MAPNPMRPLDPLLIGSFPAPPTHIPITPTSPSILNPPLSRPPSSPLPPLPTPRRARRHESISSIDLSKVLSSSSSSTSSSESDQVLLGLPPVTRSASPDVSTLLSATPRPKPLKKSFKLTDPASDDDDTRSWISHDEFGRPLTQLEHQLEVSSSSEDEGGASDSSLDLHTPLPHLMMRHGLLSPRSKLINSDSGRVSVASLASTTTVLKDTRDTHQRRVRHRDGKLLKGGIGLTTGLGWSDSEDEDAPSALTRRISSLNLSRPQTRHSSPSTLHHSLSTSSLSHTHSTRSLSHNSLSHTHSTRSLSSAKSKHRTPSALSLPTRTPSTLLSPSLLTPKTPLSASRASEYTIEAISDIDEWGSLSKSTPAGPSSWSRPRASSASRTSSGSGSLRPSSSIPEETFEGDTEDTFHRYNAEMHISELTPKKTLKREKSLPPLPPGVTSGRVIRTASASTTGSLSSVRSSASVKATTTPYNPSKSTPASSLKSPRPLKLSPSIPTQQPTGLPTPPPSTHPSPPTQPLPAPLLLAQRQFLKDRPAVPVPVPSLQPRASSSNLRTRSPMPEPTSALPRTPSIPNLTSGEKPKPRTGTGMVYRSSSGGLGAGAGSRMRVPSTLGLRGLATSSSGSLVGASSSLSAVAGGGMGVPTRPQPIPL